MVADSQKNPATRRVSILPSTNGATNGSNSLAESPGMALSPATPTSATSALGSGGGGSGGAPTLTTKQWEIPPRPRPGRKPATDTPPTKRKQQNRDAQRAFRDRRAARVQQLEWEVQQMQARLDTQRQQLTQEVRSWRARYEELQAAYEARRLGPLSGDEAALAQGVAAPINLDAPRPESHHGPPPPPPVEDGAGAGQPYDLAEAADMLVGCGRCTATSRCECLEQAMDDSAIDAGSPGMSDPASAKQSRPLSDDEGYPDAAAHKRARSSIDLGPSGPPLLLQQVSAGSMASATPGLSTEALAPADGCGFCQGGNTCPCAELAAQSVQVSSAASPPSFADTAVPPTPLDFTFPNRIVPNQVANTAPPNSTAASLPSACGNDPGSCANCRADPQGCGRFCRSLAAARTGNQIIAKGSNPLAAQPCALGAACCRLVPPAESLLAAHSSPFPPTNGNTPSTALGNETSVLGQSSQPGSNTGGGSGSTTLTCAQAFAALSQHPAFPRAQRDLPQWLPQLTTTPNLRDAAAAAGQVGRLDRTPARAEPERPPRRPADEEAAPDDAVRRAMRSRGEAAGGRTAFEIEAASVMGVMRYFDRVYGNRGG